MMDSSNPKTRNKTTDTFQNKYLKKKKNSI